MNLLLKKSLGVGLSLLFLLSGVSGALAQSSAPKQKNSKFMLERRIFLWDVTVSMVGVTSRNDSRKVDRRDKRSNPDYDYATDTFDGYIKDLDVFDATRDELIRNIESIGRNDCEIYVMAYRGESPIVALYHAENSTPESKERLISQIKAWNNLEPGKTYTGRALEHAMKYATLDRKNRIYIMTDGEASDKDKLISYIGNWPNSVEGTYTVIYVELSEDAQDDEIRVQFEDDNPNTHIVKKGEGSMNELVEFSLNDYKSSIYLNQQFNELKSLNGEVHIGCSMNGGYGEEFVVCDFECEENDYIKFDGDNIKIQNGKFVLPYELKLDSLEKYYNELNDKDAKVCLTCKVDDSCGDRVFISGPATVDVELVVKPEPRVVISISSKK